MLIRVGLILLKSFFEFVEIIVVLVVWLEWIKWGNKMFGKLRLFLVFFLSFYFVLKFVLVKSSVIECYFVW